MHSASDQAGMGQLFTNPIKAIIEAAFEHEIEVNTAGDGTFGIDPIDRFISAVECALRGIEERRSDFEVVKVPAIQRER